jgi:hypothetical protein
VTIALYSTIWVALGLFAIGETGRGRSRAAWPWRASCAGLVLAACHFLFAFHLRHDWSHALAAEATARQTAAVYGLAWGGGVYVNYVFLGVWAVDLWRWRSHAPRAAHRSTPADWLLRAFYFVIVLNAAVVFAAGWRRGLGLFLVTWLLVVWWKDRPRAAHRAGFVRRP